MLSIWLPLPEGEPRRKIEETIRHFSRRLHSPVFPPHVTLIGNAGTETKTLVEKCRTYAAARRGVFVEFSGISFERDAYYQCVFIRCGREPIFHSFRRQALRVLDGKDDIVNILPHLSLVYSDISNTQRRAVTQEAVDRLLMGKEGMYDQVLYEKGFWTDAIEVWEVHPEDKTLRSWKLIERIPFTGQE